MELVEDWAAKQGRILTGGGRLEAFFRPGRDFCDPEDLPHFYLTQAPRAPQGPYLCPNGTHEIFRDWREAGKEAVWLAGAWTRPLFLGGFEESAEADTLVRNIQTPTLFVDMRWPVLRDEALRRTGPHARPTCLQQCSDAQLKVLARQHVFAGYSLASARVYNDCAQPVVARHHAIDWNFHRGFPRSRPNMWRVEMKGDFSSFKEWAVALDDYGQCCYMERWRRLRQALRLPALASAPDARSKAPPSPPERFARCLALRRRGHCDAILCLADGHFGLAVDRVRRSDARDVDVTGAQGGGMACLVDHALGSGDRGAAEEMLSVEGSYGTVEHGKWVIAKSTHPWKEGQELFGPGVDLEVDRTEATISINGEAWDIFECNFCDRDLGRLFCRARFHIANAAGTSPSARARL